MSYSIRCPLLPVSRTGSVSASLTVMVVFSIAVQCRVPIADAEPWPYFPFDEPHGVGNHYGEFQNYGGGSYYHDGIDLVTPDGPVATYSVSDGTITHITYYQPLYSGIMIGDPVPGGEGWLYWHINANTMQFDVGDAVEMNDYIGTTADWPVADFHHVHFNRVEGTGGYPWSWYIATDNPLIYMDPHPDYISPVFQPAYQGRMFGFVSQGSGVILDPDALSGTVDIVARISDVVGLPQWPLNPWRIDAWLDGATQSIPVTNVVTFSGVIPDEGTVDVIYRTGYPMQTCGDYDNRDFYFIVTNTDGDGVVEYSDEPNAWNTDTFTPGDYWVYVRARDIGGNVVTDSMRCTVAGSVDVDIFLQETSHDFGSLPPGSTAPWLMAIWNYGTDYLSIRSMTVDSPDFSVGASHLYVEPGGFIPVTVSFSPPDTGMYESVLELTTNDTDEPVVYVDLTGTGAYPAMELSGEVSAGALVLSWSPLENTSGYWIYGAADLPWFSPQLSPDYQFRLAVLPSGVLSWSSTDGIGDPGENWDYMVIAVDETQSEIGRSNRFGEYDFPAVIP